MNNILGHLISTIMEFILERTGRSIKKGAKSLEQNMAAKKDKWICPECGHWNPNQKKKCEYCEVIRSEEK